MEQNMVNENKAKLCVSDLIRLFFKKLKVIVIIALICGIIGGALGVYFAIDNAQYTAELNIYVSPLDDTDVLLNDLRSGRFAELLLLDENGLPPKASCNAKDYENALAALKVYEDARERRWQKHVEASEHHITDVESTYKRLEEEYTRVFELLTVYKTADGETVNNEEHLKMTAIIEEKLLSIQEKKDAYYENYYVPAYQKQVQLRAELTALKDEVTAARRDAEEAVEKVLVEWRKTPGVAEKVNKIMGSTSYKYYEAESAASDAASKDPTFAEKKYIKIKISVPSKDKDFAKSLVGAYKTHLCDYVEKKIETIANTADVYCTITNPTASVVAPKSSYYVGEAVKYAVVAMIAAVVLVYIFFLCKMLFKLEMHNSKE